MDFSQISLAANTTKLQSKRNLNRNTNCECKHNQQDQKASNDSISDYQNKRDENEMSQKMYNIKLCDSAQVHSPTLNHSHQQLQPPPPIIHSTFPPPQCPSYMPMEQGIKSPIQESSLVYPFQHSYQQQPNGSFVPCSILQTQSVQPSTNLGAFFVQPNVNYPYNCSEVPASMSYQIPHFIPTITSPTAIITTPGNSPFQHPSSSMPTSSYEDTNKVYTKEDTFVKPKSPEHVKLVKSKEHSTPPDDNPGLPLQDEVCPFHQHMSYWAEQLRKNRKTEMATNEERFCFLKWVDGAFSNITVIPPGTGMWHQLNLEYLARVVTCQNGLLFPDSLVGTDNHTTMVNGLGVLGWTVGTLDAEAVMFGHPLSMPEIPKVVGVCLQGKLKHYATSTGTNQKNNFYFVISLLMNSMYQYNYFEDNQFFGLF